LAKQFEGPERQRDITIFSAFTIPEMDHHPRAVEIRNLKMGPFLKSQTAGVDCRETGAIGGKPDVSENSANLIRAQDGWKLLLAMGTDKVEDGKISVEGMFEEELDAAGEQ
jgi:hypothetical protein